MGGVAVEKERLCVVCSVCDLTACTRVCAAAPLHVRDDHHLALRACCFVSEMTCVIVDGLMNITPVTSHSLHCQTSR
eukprot:m.62452 g.62452  ORF g.62452 m.62452 type:complete len:77 (+) comp8089_c0_seq1:695-925(+)